MLVVQVQVAVRNWLTKYVSVEVASKPRIIYGGILVHILLFNLLFTRLHELFRLNCIYMSIRHCKGSIIHLSSHLTSLLEVQKGKPSILLKALCYSHWVSLFLSVLVFCLLSVGSA